MDEPLPLALRSVRELLRRAALARATGDVVVREHGGALHRITLRAGRIAAVRVAGRFDPLLERLRREGLLTAERWQAVLEALGRSELRAGQLAVEIGGVPHARIREALEAQTRRSLAEALERAFHHGRDAWLEPRAVSPAELATSLDVHAALSVGPGPNCRALSSGPGPNDRRRDRRALRRLAFALHPDRHGHLDPEARAALAARLAAATAAFHGLR